MEFETKMQIDIDNNIAYYVLSRIPDFGAKKVRYLVDKVGSAVGVLECPEKEIFQIMGEASQDPDIRSPFRSKDLETLLEGRRIFFEDPEKAVSSYYELASRNIQFFGENDPRYPIQLKCLDDRPAWLYVKGSFHMALDDRYKDPYYASENGCFRSIAIVGARSCSSYGREMAMELGRRVCERGIDVISGMALGIDGYAHKGAIDAIDAIDAVGIIKAVEQTTTSRSSGYTYAVLGSGIDVCYPRQNSDIYYKLTGGSARLRTGISTSTDLTPTDVAADGTDTAWAASSDTTLPEKRNHLSYGGVISEFPPGTKPLAGQFPMRNRIISGLADAVIVVEAREKSGSLITANIALDQGREVYVIPGRITDPLSRGCNELAEIGAHLITDLDDFVNFISPFHKSTLESENYHYHGLATNEKLLYSCLDFESRFLGTIVDLSGLSYQDTVAGLMELVRKGLIIEGPKNYYSLRLR